MSTGSIALRPHARRELARQLHRSPAGSSSGAGQVWRVWPGREWPATASEEERFVGDLRDLVGAPGDVPAADGGTEFTRADHTVLLNALRCGLRLAELSERAPGVQPMRLLAAYESLDARRHDAELAWAAIVADPTPDSLMRHGTAAAALLPVVIDRLADVWERGEHDREREGFAALVAVFDAEVHRVGGLARDIDATISDAATTSHRRERLGELLFDRQGLGLWSHECFVADRVGSLVPVRVATLLGESAPMPERW